MITDEHIPVASHDGQLLGERDRFAYNRKSRAKIYLCLSIACVCVCVLGLVKGNFSLLAYLIVLGIALLFALGVEALSYRARNVAVTLDYSCGVVVLEHFVYPLSFWDFHRKAEVATPFSEIQHVGTTYSHGSTTYWVYTKESRFSFGSGIDRAGLLAMKLQEIASNTELMNPLRSIWVIAFAGGFVGLGIVALLGWMLGWI